ncbi:RraA family protein [Caldalkalibacillus uzonensis]|uniref:Putative 4-hydroxy-4-methyl-2-oxoglutarate aldolase n=1 Tax=Caldalkalibacillus uzonensis TaxID=353224 RepID=A0ABU0CTK0_9BACI|nr:RraA family protein [Caldalkalibacillus uzonensis]MDQ0339423.1 RraA family protein [Caldalkalibacillus uzonensis]
MNQVIELLKTLPTTVVSDALGGLYHLDPAIKPLKEEWKVAGKVRTVKLRAADNKLLLQAMREAEDGEVLVIDARGYTYNAIVGDFMVELAKLLGIAGLVIDGAVRDVQGIKKIDLPVFCRSVTVAASDKSGSGEVDVPISCAGASVKPGDLIVGDADGVVVIPQEKAETVVAKAQEKVQKDLEREAKVLASREAAMAYLDKALGKQ